MQWKREMPFLLSPFSLRAEGIIYCEPRMKKWREGVEGVFEVLKSVNGYYTWRWTWRLSRRLRVIEGVGYDYQQL